MRKPWSSLDNAAKIFPPAESKTNTQVFRFVCELCEPVDGELLQRALDDTIKTFDIFQCVMRRGLFWYYLENSDIKPVVREEYKTPCARIYDSDVKALLYEVTYYHNRINLEIFHALSDGTGAVQFLKEITARYISLAHGLAMPPLGYKASRIQMGDDSFQKYTTGKRSVQKVKYQTAASLTGARLSEQRVKIITARLSVRSALDCAHKYGATLTSFIIAVFMRAIAGEMTVRAKSRPVIIAVPVNLRRFFPSESARNFFSIIHVSYDFVNSPDTLEDVCASVDEQMKRQLTRDKLSQTIDGYTSVERNIFARVAPLFFKYIVLKSAYALTQKRATATISNVGGITMPAELMPYINGFDVFNNTGKLQGCVCSYGDRLAVSFTSQFLSSDIERAFVTSLIALGVDVEITANSTDDK
ncbi:MAG: hypothetical protein WCQ72_05885 [Eubacteriales bacterium]